MKKLFLFFCILSLNARADWERSFWIDKVSRSLSASKRTLSKDEIEKLESLSDDEIINKFLNDPFILESVYRFNLYFLGHSPDFLSLSSQYIPTSLLAKAPSAILSAQNFWKKGNYLDLFNYYLPLYSNLPRKINPQIFTRIDSLEKKLFDEYPKMPDGWCNDYRGLNSNLDYILAFPAQLNYEFDFSRKWRQPINVACSSNLTQQPEALREQMQSFNKKFKILTDRLKSLYPDNIAPKTVLDYKSIDVLDLDLEHKFFSASLGSSLPNMLPNLNRKRAAYVLNQFFCDNLAIANSDKAIGPHKDLLLNSRNPLEESCMSCHARLDPMAGFFKSLGSLFLNMSPLGVIRLDGDSIVNRAEYESNWKNLGPNATRKWNIGYIRSDLDTSINDYGETPEDLSKILKKSSEVRYCIAKKLYAYLVNPKQKVDPEYLHSLSKKLNVPEEESSKGLALMMSDIVKSQAYRLRNPDLNTCYDQASNSNGLPCEISYVLKNNCINCHSNTRNKVKLNQLVQMSDGIGFEHLNSEGVQLPIRDSFAIIQKRITSTNSDLVMPRGSIMSYVDRETLYAWLSNNAPKEEASE